MVGVLLLLNPVIAPFTDGGWLARVLALAVLIGSGGLAYAIAARLLGIFTLTALRSQFSRKDPAK